MSINEFRKYPRIGQFRQAVKEMKRCGLNDVEYSGSVKLHGSNACVNITTEAIEYQSRSRIMGGTDDNCGFKALLQGVDKAFMMNGVTDGDQLLVYGEICGGNIQKNVAINGLEKMFVIFDMNFNGTWATPDEVGMVSAPKEGVYNINNFSKFTHTINVSKPTISQDVLSKLTMNIDAKCPVGEHFGKIGIGEGIVWKPVDPLLLQNTSLWFKTKGPSHSKSKVKVIAPPTPEQLVKESKVVDFVTYALEGGRLDQGLSMLRENGLEVDRSSTGAFLSWLVKDIAEEEADVLEANDLVIKDVSKMLSTTAREWYFNKVDECDE